LEFDAIFYNLLLTFIHPNLYFKKYYKNTQYNCRYQSGQGLYLYFFIVPIIILITNITTCDAKFHWCIYK